MEIPSSVLPIMSGKPDSTFCDRRRKAAKAELLELAERMERGIYD